MWDRYEFKRGDRVARADGAWAEVLSVLEAGTMLHVHYGGGEANSSLAGTEGKMRVEEIISVSPAPPGPRWGESVGVVIHRIPESEEGEAGYGAVTVSGVPFGVCVEAEDTDSAAGAFDRLLGALKAFGFKGTVAVEDATYIGGSQRYEVDVF